MRPWRALAAAITFLTRVPLPGAEERAPLADGAPYYPMVGAILGLLSFGIERALRPALPATVVAIVVIAVHVGITGALHLDGLADTADGFGGGHRTEQILRIMRDTATGTFGTVAVVLLLLLKWTCLSSLSTAAKPVLIAAPLLARWSVLPTARFFPAARDSSGLGSALRARTSWGTLAWGSSLLLLPCLVLPLAQGICLIGISLSFTLLFGLLCRSKIGGFTGDTLGAQIEMSEASLYFTSLLLFGPS